MAAFRGKNLRAGDLAEQIGVLLLQSVALVAPVPRTEDVGIDAVVTLIRDFDSKRYIAEDSFFVQIKARSVKTINFNKDQLNWLLNLELPFFVASVDRKTSEIELYCAHRLSDAVITNHKRESIVIHLDYNPNQDHFVDGNDPNVLIGPPILKWDFSTLDNLNDFPNLFFQVVKSHIKVAKRALSHRKVGISPNIEWSTNVVPEEFFGWKSAISRTPEESRDLAYDEMMPYFDIWLQELIRTKDMAHAKDVMSLLEKAQAIVEAMNGKK